MRRAAMFVVMLVVVKAHADEGTPGEAPTDVSSVLGASYLEMNGTVVVESQHQLAEAAKSSDVDVIPCLTTMEITGPVDLADALLQYGIPLDADGCR